MRVLSLLIIFVFNFYSSILQCTNLRIGLYLQNCVAFRNSQSTTIEVILIVPCHTMKQ